MGRGLLSYLARNKNNDVSDACIFLVTSDSLIDGLRNRGRMSLLHQILLLHCGPIS